MKKFIISLIVILVILMIALITIGSTSYENINVSSLDKLMEENPKYHYVDVRTKEEFNQGHIAGFENIVDQTILNGQDAIKNDTTIVLICNSGNRSSTVAKYLSDKGYEVINVKDGIKNYKGELI